MAQEPTFCDKLHASRPCSPWCPHGSGEVTSAPGEDEKLMGIEDIEADLNNDTSKKHIMSFVANIIHIYIYVCIYIKSYIIDNYIYIHIIYIYLSLSLSLSFSTVRNLGWAETNFDVW